MRLPEFVIIGAPKAATTWLTTVLRQQPSVFMPEPEIHFFNRHHDRGLGWYAGNFADAREDQIVGEKSASYLADPAVPARMRQTLPDARLIVQLRNPIDRAYSDYCMLLRRGEVGSDIERQLDPVRSPTRRFVEDGLYGRHLQAFLEEFPREQVRVLLYDDIAREPGRVFEEIVGFLRLRDPVPPDTLGRRVKIKEAPMLPLQLRRLLRPLKGAAQPLRGHPVFRRVHGFFSRPVRYPSLEARLRQQLADYYADDVKVLARLIDRDLEGWLRPGGAAS